ncbi:hypothetical protein Fcan01_23995 [Folsomia candida]|uniref:Uncharacterized protein n=1 Tax=Folsomia candida TaxID=158441 RepID=A0A226DAM8_FOLCA|nr:hypothetical protein Fcan01_23995 [Folsomia candida]
MEIIQGLAAFHVFICFVAIGINVYSYTQYKKLEDNFDYFGLDGVPETVKQYRKWQYLGIIGAVVGSFQLLLAKAWIPFLTTKRQVPMRDKRLLFGLVQCVVILLMLQCTFVLGVYDGFETHWSIYVKCHGGAAFIAFYGGLTVHVVKLGWRKQKHISKAAA